MAKALNDNLPFGCWKLIAEVVLRETRAFSSLDTLQKEYKCF